MGTVRIERDEQLHLRKFWPVDRDSPIYEIIVDNEVLFDVAREDATFSITFHATISNVMIACDVLKDAILSAKSMIVQAEQDETET